MPQTARFKEMRSRLGDLRKHMLPQYFSAMGVYTERQKDRARGYRLLVHAEIESYIEDTSKNVVVSAVQKWDSANEASEALVALLAAYHCSWYADDSLADSKVLEFARSRKAPSKAAADVVRAAMEQYAQVLKDNHGIKERNLRKILVPAGVDLDSLDGTWLTTLDDFGGLRGQAAHQTARVSQTIDPRAEYDRTKQLLQGLEELDKVLFQLMS
ncbi:MAG: HEPN domain-containing protein [Coriobacteriia bacterium]